MTYIGEANMGSVHCDEYGYHVPRGSVLGYDEPGYRGEYFMIGDGSATNDVWSPNRLTFNISANSPATLVINQNADPDWRVVSGNGTRRSERDLLAIDVPAGQQSLTIAYRPANIGAALLMTLTAAIATLALWFWERRRMSRSSD